METAHEPNFLENSLLFLCNFLLGVIFIGGVATNLLVILVFYRKPGIRTTANRFVINLMIINLLACLSLVPVTLVENTTANNYNYLGKLEEFSSVFCSSAIVYAVLLIAIDQYFAVVDPLHYHGIISSWKGYFMILSTWVFSAVLAFLSSIHSDFGLFHNNTFQHSAVGSENPTITQTDMNIALKNLEADTRQENSHTLYREIFSVSYVVVAFLTPFGFIIFFYYRICAAASGNSRRTRTSMLANEDSSQVIRDKFPSDSATEITSFISEKNPEKGGNMSSDSPETCRLLRESSRENSNPSLVLTRPSPPRPSSVENTSDVKCECAEKQFYELKASQDKMNSKAESEVLFLKPTLKHNQSFSKLSSTHIQFSNSTEKLNSTGRRHSNISTTIPDPEFENLSKARSSSMQSTFYDISSRSSSSTRSTATSVPIQSSRSSSLNSTSARHPPSRASSIRSTSSYIVNNIRHRISNASLFRYREEARAARISAVVIVMALFCWLPFFTVFLLHSGVCVVSNLYFSYFANVFSVVFLLSSTVVTPFLFAFRNRQIKKEIRKIFRTHREGLKTDSSKSFYRHNFALSLKNQAVNLFTELNKQQMPVTA